LIDRAKQTEDGVNHQEVHNQIVDLVRNVEKRTDRLEQLLEVFVPFAAWSDAERAKGREEKLTLQDFLVEISLADSS
jgi:hypothetical protein